MCRTSRVWVRRDASSRDAFAYFLRIVANPLVLWIFLFITIYVIYALAKRVRKGTKEEARLRAEIYAIKELGGVDREGVVKVGQADESRVGLIDAFEVEMAERATAPMY